MNNTTKLEQLYSSESYKTRTKIKSTKRKQTSRQPRKVQTPKCFWLDVGKNISLALIAAKYDGDQGDSETGGER
jgi:hypothetical protein